MLTIFPSGKINKAMNWGLLRVRWKLDCDYAQKLSAEALQWLRKFEREYYGAEFGHEALHSKAQQREIVAEQDVARRDIATATSRAISAAQNPAKSRDRFRRYYGPSDYSEYSVSPEDELIIFLEMRDAARRKRPGRRIATKR
jgi:hypothetical protein